MCSLATIKEIADKCKLSASTVSRVLNNDVTISVQLETREKIFRVAKDLGYKTVMERKLEQQRNSKPELEIGILLCQSYAEEIGDPYFLSIRQGAEMELSQQGARTFVFRLNEIESSATLEHLDGLIVIGRVNATALRSLSNLENVVYINHTPNIDLYDSVIINFENATEKALRYLLECGYKRIGYIGGKEKEHLRNLSKTYEDKRILTFVRFLTERNLYNEAAVLVGEYTMSDGYELMKRAISVGLQEAYFIASDPMAIGALRALQEAGIRVPEDVGIVGFDDIEATLYSNPPLTTVKVHTNEMGKLGVKLLLDRMVGLRKLPLTVTVPTELTVRESCRQLNN